MKAIVCTQYGTPDVLQLQDVPKPIPRDDEALVKVCATSVNAADLETLRGEFVVRIAAPLRPMHRILGTDVAGQVEAVGSRVTQFRPGDEIWGDLSYPLSSGALAEYVCIPEAALRRKPVGMTFEQAAATPTAGVVAVQNLRWKGRVQPGQKVLINGAGGAVGTFALQLAKHFGAHVTVVDSAAKSELLRSLGADEFIDYTQQDYTASGQQYDRILDVVAYRSVFAHRRALSLNGVFIYVGGSTSAVFQGLLLAPLLSRFGSQTLGVGMWEPNKEEDLAFLGQLFEAGKVAPVIDKHYPLEETAEAFRYVQAGRQLGKVVITVQEAPPD